jgi:hypothetical protein
LAEQWPKGTLSNWQSMTTLARQNGDERFDWDQDPEVQTDKEQVKLLPCQYCQCPLVVTTFYVLSWAKCSNCAGENRKRDIGSVEHASVKTDPKLAVNLEKTLINKTFAEAWCPVDPGHEMELKQVNHSKNYGPWVLRLVDGKPIPVQTAPGETVLHQCKDCNAVVTYSTTAVTQFRRINEIGEGKNANANARTLGTRDDVLEQWLDKEDDFIYPVEEAIE